MRHAQLLLAALLLVFGLILCADQFHPAQAQTPPVQPNPPAPIHLGTESKLLFDHSGLDAKGNPETLKDCEFGLSSPLVVDLNQQPTPQLITSATAPVKAGANSVALGPTLSTYSDGQYRLWLRVRDARNNATPWVGGILVALDAAPPALPTNIRISFDGTASLEIQGNQVKAEITGKLAKN
jgi:hypothetical protein